eukprot:scaffold103298_cov16-Tisochrysis_lutea.AAC.2
MLSVQHTACIGCYSCCSVQGRLCKYSLHMKPGGALDASKGSCTYLQWAPNGSDAHGCVHDKLVWTKWKQPRMNRQAALAATRPPSNCGGGDDDFVDDDVIRMMLIIVCSTAHSYTGRAMPIIIEKGVVKGVGLLIALAICSSPVCRRLRLALALFALAFRHSNRLLIFTAAAAAASTPGLLLQAKGRVVTCDKASKTSSQWTTSARHGLNI